MSHRDETDAVKHPTDFSLPRRLRGEHLHVASPWPSLWLLLHPSAPCTARLISSQHLSAFFRQDRLIKTCCCHLYVHKPVREVLLGWMKEATINTDYLFRTVFPLLLGLSRKRWEKTHYRKQFSKKKKTVRNISATRLLSLQDQCLDCQSVRGPGCTDEFIHPTKE